MLLIDISMVFHRCLHKLDFLKTSTGIHTGIEFGTFRILESLPKKFPDQEIILAFDQGRPKRKDIDPAYKANRNPKSDEFYSRINKLKIILSQLYRTASEEDEEADEIICDLAHQYPGPHFIYSNDDDLLQVIDDEREIQVVKSFESKLYFWDEEKVREKYRVGPALLPIFRAFTGDKSDNIPGIPRINKLLLAEALYFSLEHCKTDSTFGYLNIMKENNLFSENMKIKIIEWIESGRFVTNYRLLKLGSLNIRLEDPKHDLNKVKKYLEKLEIYSLKICKKLGMNAIQPNEEF